MLPTANWPLAITYSEFPDVLLCDEPTGALDYATGKLVLEAIERVNREVGTTTAIITHNAAIADLADRVLHMRSGAIACQINQAFSVHKSLL